MLNLLISLVFLCLFSFSKGNASPLLFSVQVFSGTDEIESLEKSAFLMEKGYESFYRKAKVKGKDYFRVYIGVFLTKEEAELEMKRFQSEFPKVEPPLVMQISKGKKK